MTQASTSTERMWQYADWIWDCAVSNGWYVHGLHVVLDKKIRVSVAKEMQQHFPELTCVYGYGSPGGEHAWLTTPYGEVVDPTAKQFPFQFMYEPWEPGDLCRVGYCIECGVGIYDYPKTFHELRHGIPTVNTTTCSDECRQALKATYDA